MAKTEFKNVGKYKEGSKIYYRGQLVHKNQQYQSRRYLTSLEAAKWVDLKCLELNIPQKNNTFKKK